MKRRIYIVVHGYLSMEEYQTVDETIHNVEVFEKKSAAVQYIKKQFVEHEREFEVHNNNYIPKLTSDDSLDPSFCYQIWSRLV